ncbi:hypothetical protein D3C86_1539430 [compost metagenome]
MQVAVGYLLPLEAIDPPGRLEEVGRAKRGKHLAQAVEQVAQGAGGIGVLRVPVQRIAQGVGLDALRVQGQQREERQRLLAGPAGGGLCRLREAGLPERAHLEEGGGFAQAEFRQDLGLALPEAGAFRRRQDRRDLIDTA